MLDGFFLSGDIPSYAETGEYILYLVALSYAIATLASYSALDLGRNIVKVQDQHLKKLMHYGGSFVMGSGIWAMHFIGMLSYNMDMYVEYDAILTVVSAVPAIIVSYFVLGFVKKSSLNFKYVILAGVLLGIGISTMHYIGMLAMEMDGDILYIPSLFLLSVLIAISASSIALFVIFIVAHKNYKHQSLFKIGAAFILGGAICGMHYTAMAATVFIPWADCRYDQNQSYVELALMIASISSFILGVTSAFMVYLQMQKKGKTINENNFPTKIISVAAILSLVVMIWGGWSNYRSYYNLLDTIDELVETKKHTDLLMELDNILTYSATMASKTGEPNWEENYNKNVIALDKTLAIIKERYQNLDLLHVNETDEANDKLVAMEASVFAHVSEGNLISAQNIMSSTRYIENKAVYARGMREFLQQVSEISHSKLPILARSIQYVLYPIVIILVLLAIVWFFVFRSIRNWQKQLEKEKKKADDANRAKSDFLANMSHELRTPLNSILGMSALLSETLDGRSEEQRMVTVLNQSSSSLLDIVNDILDISKIEAEKIVLDSIGFSFQDTLSSVIEPLTPAAHSKGITLKYQFVDKDIPYLLGDPTRITRVLMNLVDNALKYTAKGSVEVLIDCQEISPDKVELKCSVIDTGIGISEDMLIPIFDKFSQVDETITRRYGGAGLGLSITKEFIEMMGGKLGVDSKEGEGSTFWFKIPFATTKVLPEASKNGDSLLSNEKMRRGKVKAEDARILIAEDHALNQIVIEKLLNRIGFTHIDQVENGALALDAYKKRQYDIILMDCHMPEMDGFQATEEIRSIERDMGGHIPIVAVTADAMVGVREKCFNTGMDAYISKPIDLDEFQKVLDCWFFIPLNGGTQ